ncbi:MAG: hypothetical protein IPL46_17345 [Saprospiraceae bacterium]|nr:hypothetical protein [Saprospiraceae bacterium]
MRIRRHISPVKPQSIENVSFHSFIEERHGADMYHFVKHLVGSSNIDLADQIYQKAMERLKQKKDLLKISVVLEPWLTVYFHNFCRIEMERYNTRLVDF